MAIVKKIVEEHGGLVMIRNNVDGPGACVIIRLPVTRSGIAQARAASGGGGALT